MFSWRFLRFDVSRSGAGLCGVLMRLMRLIDGVIGRVISRLSFVADPCFSSLFDLSLKHTRNGKEVRAEYLIESSPRLRYVLYPLCSVDIQGFVGYDVPVLGLGVYQNWECYPACIAAIEAGYRYVCPVSP